MRKATFFIALAFLLTLCAIPVYAADIPPLPHAFYGALEVNGSDAAPGYTVEARGEGVTTGIASNPIVTEEVGWYGSADPLGVKLIVQGDILDGETITFYVNGRLATSDPATVVWHSGDTSEVDLTVTITIPAPGGGGFAPTPDIETNLFGIEADFDISNDGEIQETIEATSEAGDLTIVIEEGTIALDEDGEPLDTLEIIVDETPPDPPEDAYVIGLAYDFGPDGATFDPPLIMTYTLDLDDLPEGIAPEDLVIAYWDGDEWVELDSDVDVENSTITIESEVEHFTTFAVIGRVAPTAFSLSSLSVQPAEVEPGETVTIAVSVANTGGTEGDYTVVLTINGAKEAERSGTVAARDSEDVSFTVSREDAGSYSVVVDGLSGSFTVVAPAPPPAVPAPAAPEVPPVIPPPAPPVNWTIWGPIIGVAVFLAIFLPIRLRRRRRLG